MALVSYSDSEGSDSETERKTQPPAKKEIPTFDQPKPSKPAAGFQPLVDRSNPRKLRVALPEIKPETQGEAAEEDGGPARKRAKLGGGGAFSGFNSFLPAPKRSAQSASGGQDKKSAPARKVFSLKTGATPGFDRGADAEMRHEQALNGDAGADVESIPTAGSLRGGPSESAPVKEEPKKIGNAMMFKPLSVARNTQKKKTSIVPSRAATDGLKKTAPAEPAVDSTEKPMPASNPPPPQKPKVSLFSLASEERVIAPDASAETAGTYQPLVYDTGLDEAPAGPQAEPSASEPQLTTYEPTPTDTSTTSQTLDDIATDLNLSRSQRRQLIGRQPASSKSRILSFNTDAEYASNQAYLNEASRAELAAQQHNPVRAIAPGKHTLQQLVNAASTQKDALEESFAAGRRNKKEAGSRYGW